MTPARVTTEASSLCCSRQHSVVEGGSRPPSGCWQQPTEEPGLCCLHESA